MAGVLDKYQFDPLVQFNFEQVTVDATAGGVAFTAATLANAKMAICTVETAAIRIAANTVTTVSSTVGTLYNAGDQFVIYGSENLKNFKAIRTTGSSATLDCEYYR